MRRESESVIRTPTARNKRGGALCQVKLRRAREVANKRPACRSDVKRFPFADSFRPHQLPRWRRARVCSIRRPACRTRHTNQRVDCECLRSAMDANHLAITCTCKHRIPARQYRWRVKFEQ
eukprot:2059547-Pleurochrysis_carterae.AAC.5